MERYCFGKEYMPTWLLSAISCGLVQLDSARGCLVVDTGLGDELVEFGDVITFENGELVVHHKSF